jgi:hypothetical protein
MDFFILGARMNLSEVGSSMATVIVADYMLGEHLQQIIRNQSHFASTMVYLPVSIRLGTGVYIFKREITQSVIYSRIPVPIDECCRNHSYGEHALLLSVLVSRASHSSGASITSLLPIERVIL